MEREDTQLYQELGINPSKHDVLKLSEKDIASAYRKAALLWHPDKNRDDPKAAEKFSRVFLAYETLSSVSQRQAYDEKIRLFRQRRKSFLQQDATRRQMRQQLEQRELKAAQAFSQPATRTRATGFNNEDAFSRIQREVERLRKQANINCEDDQENTPKQKTEFKSGGLPTTIPTAHPKYSTNDSGLDNHGLQVPWTKVPGYSVFRSKSSIVPFDEFETAILHGQSPF